MAEGKRGRNGEKWSEVVEMQEIGSEWELRQDFFFCFVMPLPVQLPIRPPRAALACFWGGGGGFLSQPEGGYTRGGSNEVAQMK